MEATLPNNQLHRRVDYPPPLMLSVRPTVVRGWHDAASAESDKGGKRLATGWKLFCRRAGAYVVDVIALFLVLGPLGWLIQRALGLAPSTGVQIWVTLLLNFSLPAGVYFAVADASRAGATLGKRLLGLRVALRNGGRIRSMRALGRTAAKLLPWELVHVSAFALQRDPGVLSTVQGVGLVLANALALAYLACAALTHGHRSIHDLMTGTVVAPAA